MLGHTEALAPQMGRIAMARLRKTLGVVGIFLVAIFGTWGFLTQSTDPNGSRQSLVIAAFGFVLWIQLR